MGPISDADIVCGGFHFAQDGGWWVAFFFVETVGEFADEVYSTFVIPEVRVLEDLTRVWTELAWKEGSGPVFWLRGNHTQDQIPCFDCTVGTTIQS
jgi:hypothetical protein